MSFNAEKVTKDCIEWIKELDDYIKYGIVKNKESLNKIERMHTISKHKRDSAPIFRYENRE